jgi:hypothetical protein
MLYLFHYLSVSFLLIAFCESFWIGRFRFEEFFSVRLITHEDELQFEALMLTKAATAEKMGEVDEDTKRQVCTMLQHLTSLHSPCQMLDSLVSLLKVLASTSDENNHCKLL